jgi:hypothetical protein
MDKPFLEAQVSQPIWSSIQAHACFSKYVNLLLRDRLLLVGERWLKWDLRDRLLLVNAEELTMPWQIG